MTRLYRPGGKEMETSRQVILITGAGSGVGRATALAFARRGARLVLAGRRPDILEAVTAQCRDARTEALAVKTDVSDPAQVKALFAAGVKQFGRIDVLFNNAGGGTAPGPMEDVPFEQWQAVVGANVTGPFLCSQEAIRIMKSQDPQGGRIINNGSISAQTPRIYSAPYTITKHAINGLTKSIALEGRKYNIACGQIDIGNAETEMTKRIKSGAPQADGTLKPEPLMDVELVADAVVRMAELPLDANILSMTIMATAMPFVGRG
jgi:NAD(P)-dependent dehydrogenase (short-subunit alcohol dehydrogenase family)